MDNKRFGSNEAIRKLAASWPRKLRFSRSHISPFLINLGRSDSFSFHQQLPRQKSFNDFLACHCLPLYSFLNSTRLFTMCNKASVSFVEMFNQLRAKLVRIPLDTAPAMKLNG